MSEGMQEIAVLRKEMTQCKNDVHAKIENLVKGQAKLEVGHKKLEDAIHGQSLERKQANDEMKLFFKDMQQKLNAHTEDEMSTIEQMHVTLSKLVEQTDMNTSFISSVQQQEEIDRQVKEQIDAKNKPREEMWHKAKMTAIVVLTTGGISAIGSGIWVIFKMYLLLSPDGA